MSETQGDHYFHATERMRERAEKAERELAVVERASQDNANAHMAEVKRRQKAEATLARIEKTLGFYPDEEINYRAAVDAIFDILDQRSTDDA